MAEFTFYLASPKSEKSSVQLYIRWGHATVKYSPGISVQVKDWIPAKQKVKVDADNPLGADKNAELSTVKADMEVFFNDLRHKFGKDPCSVAKSHRHPRTQAITRFELNTSRNVGPTTGPPFFCTSMAGQTKNGAIRLIL